MKPKKSQLNKLKIHLTNIGPGGKLRLAERIGCAPSEISRLLKGNGISQDKWEKIEFQMCS